jgi:hypothetical protein
MCRPGHETAQTATPALGTAATAAGFSRYKVSSSSRVYRHRIWGFGELTLCWHKGDLQQTLHVHDVRWSQKRHNTHHCDHSSACPCWCVCRVLHPPQHLVVRCCAPQLLKLPAASAQHSTALQPHTASCTRAKCICGKLSYGKPLRSHPKPQIMFVYPNDSNPNLTRVGASAGCCTRPSILSCAAVPRSSSSSWLLQYSGMWLISAGKKAR